MKYDPRIDDAFLSEPTDEPFSSQLDACEGSLLQVRDPPEHPHGADFHIVDLLNHGGIEIDKEDTKSRRSFASSKGRITLRGNSFNKDRSQLRKSKRSIAT